MAKNNNNFFENKNEWSEIKDTLLGCYLPQYFQKLLTTEKPIYYVDCFAGKGKFDDGKDGSPLIALKIRNKCLSRSRAIQAKYDGAIKTCFIELNYVEDLRNNLINTPVMYDKPEVVGGRFEDNILQLLSDKKDYNVFLYIDPYGIKALDSKLLEAIHDFGFYSFEMLINFNSFGFFRDACRVMKVDYSNDNALKELSDLVEIEPTQIELEKNSDELLNAVAGGDYWKRIVEGYQNHQYDGYKAESMLSDAYRDHLKEKYSFVLDMPIRLKSGRRPKYRMIHVCDHEDACFLMAQNMQNRKNELAFNIQNAGQMTLFSYETEMRATVEGDLITEEEIKTKVEEYIDTCKKETRIRKFIAGFCNKNGLICDFKTIYSALSDLEKNGEIEIIRNPKTTKTGKTSRFWDEKNNNTVTIRRVKNCEQCKRVY